MKLPAIDLGLMAEHLAAMKELYPSWEFIIKMSEITLLKKYCKAT
ncbi:hypothetical protein [Bacillus sp. P14.5]|nr:hypothetical protein [Bacillus sp. P14.5]